MVNKVILKLMILLVFLSIACKSTNNINRLSGFYENKCSGDYVFFKDSSYIISNFYGYRYNKGFYDIEKRSLLLQSAVDSSISFVQELDNNENEVLFKLPLDENPDYLFITYYFGEKRIDSLIDVNKPFQLQQNKNQKIDSVVIFDNNIVRFTPENNKSYIVNLLPFEYYSIGEQNWQIKKNKLISHENKVFKKTEN